MNNVRKEMPGVLIYREGWQMLSLLPDETIGTIIRSTSRYIIMGTIPDYSDLPFEAQTVGYKIVAYVNESREKYKKTVERNTANSHKRANVQRKSSGNPEDDEYFK